MRPSQTDIHPGEIGPHTTMSGRRLQTVYRPEDIAEVDYETHLGDPGQYPFTRGVHPDMYRGKLWTMRQFAGFGSARQTNERFKFLLSRGQTGLSTAFDLPTLMGRDADDPLSLGEVGRCGVAVSSLADYEVLFGGIDLGGVSVSMTINAPAAILIAFYVATADKQGVPRKSLRGTCQNDILKEFHAQNEFVFPPAESVRLVVDTIEFCQKELPQYNPVSISGYHIREAGSTAGQELAFTLGDGLAYAQACVDRGMDIDSFAPRLSFFFNSHNDFFEEIAKFRAARRLWAWYMKERFGAKNERSMWLRFHAQTAGCSLYSKQPHVNLMRVAYQAMAAVLGGCQSLHTNSMDETVCLPTEHAVTLALRTQQVLACETGVTNVVDPLGGSYFVEALTNQLEAEAREYIEHIEEMGGMIAAIENGYVRREIADAAYRYSAAVERGDKKLVGVTDYTDDDGPRIDMLKIPDAVEREVIADLKKMKAGRNDAMVKAALKRITDDARAGVNVMESLIAGAKAYATVGEMMQALEASLGRFDTGQVF
ncbi:MAG: methylmalonyl-CoA mutase [Phycisphaerae bacterium]|nr:MAG: methylmalonyl-CoA mutase [Planctomycetia bacterium]GJQ25045.1 MAG: methylmalonyl-CoA mutase [Phycisphaerae bacterium]